MNLHAKIDHVYARTNLLARMFIQHSLSILYRWQDEMDPGDRLARAHYRYIQSITVSDPQPLGPHQHLAVKVTDICTSICQLCNDEIW